MQRSSKQRRKMAGRWRRSLVTALCAASFATGAFVWGEESAAPRKKLPTKSVAVLPRQDAGSTSSAPKLLGPRGGVIRPVAIQEIPAVAVAKPEAAKAEPIEYPRTNSAAITLPSKLETAAPLKLEAAAPIVTRPIIAAPVVPSKPIPPRPLSPQLIINHQMEEPKEQLAPIVSASSFQRAAPQQASAPETADESSDESAATSEPAAADPAEEPLSPWMQDIRSTQPAENPLRLEATQSQPAPERPRLLAPPKSPARRTIFERAALPAEQEISLQGNETSIEPAEPAELREPTEAAREVPSDDPPELEEEEESQEPAPIVDPPSRSRLAPSKPRRAKPPAAEPKLSLRKPVEEEFAEEESAKPAPLVMAVQNAQPRPAAPAELPAPAVDKDADLKKHFEVIQQTGEFSVQVHRSKLLRTAKDIYRTAVVDDAVLEIVQFTPREISLIGRAQGATHVTFWFDDPATQPVTYLVTVEPDAGQVKIDEEKYQLLEDMINEMFPDSKIHLQLIANKLVVRGQARDSEEAFQIMSLIRVQGGFGGAPGAGAFGNGYGVAGIGEGPAADPLMDSATGAARRSNYQIINMLRVPGVQQVALRVKIAELNRTAARNFGMNVQGQIDISNQVDGSKVLLNSILGTGGTSTPAVIANFDGDDITVGLNTLAQHGVIKLLSEPTLVTLSGNPATFIAGGEFAVPTIVGSAGLNAVTTDFRAFGAIISFLPTVVDKDRIRLQVAPEFSQINSELRVNGTPGLKVRAATTTVEMREGQTLAIAGLLEDSVNANTAGDIPFLAKWIGKRGVTRAETELIILVTPELVHPLEPEEVPPLPGFDVTEPTNKQFYFHGDIEGNPTMDYRSTVWPRLKKRYKAGGPAMTSGPFGHGQ